LTLFPGSVLSATVEAARKTHDEKQLENTTVSGVLYGVAVYFFMNRIVVPLSAAATRPFSMKFMIVGMIIHIFCVGLPIPLTVRRFSK